MINFQNFSNDTDKAQTESILVFKKVPFYSF